ncbi:MAG: hypothetical protein A2X32_05885 [Elusimicrobia bacterium GWC2_64_44]|nr:MAG: hypothetical protein A2X32_05885 [Elusimicrobia bacterium GWC2_64_44]
MKRCRAGSIRQLRPRAFFNSRLHIKFLDLPGSFPVAVAHEIIHENGAAIPWGVHKRTAEFIYVLSGRARACLGNVTRVIRPGDYLVIPPGVKHRIVTGKEPLVALSVFSPPMGFGNLDAAACPPPRKVRKAA